MEVNHFATTYLNGTDSFRDREMVVAERSFPFRTGVEFPGVLFFLENSKVYTWYLLTDHTYTSSL